MATNVGYLRFPAIRDETVVFGSEDDLWTVPATGGVARRLTANLAETARPQLSPDGRWLAFTSREEGQPEAWLMPAEGGQARRLTFLGNATTATVGWSPDGRLAIVSAARQPFRWWTMPLLVDPNSGATEELPVGPCRDLSWAPGGGGLAIVRNAYDPARWKRYRGGTAGQLWVDRAGDGKFRRLLADLDTNLAQPMWVGGRIYFVSDHEGVGNLYSVRPTGADLRRHTDHDRFYVRYPNTDGARIVYQHAAEIWLYDPATDQSARIDIETRSPRVQRNRRFVPAADFMTAYTVHPDGRSITVETRGQLFDLPLWEQAARPLSPGTGVRQRAACWLPGGEFLVAVSDEGGEEHLVVHGPDGTRTLELREDIGDVHELVAAPAGPARVAVVNQRHELWVVDVGAGSARLLDASEAGALAGAAWSPDGGWLAYAVALTRTSRSIRIVEVSSGARHDVTRPEFRDFAPAWDPSGRYLYFLSGRVFDPVPDEHFFDLGFPKTVKPYVVPLRLDARSPFRPEPRPMRNPPASDDTKTDATVVLDIEELHRRAVELPVPAGRYLALSVLDDAVLLLSAPVEGILNRVFGGDPPPKFSIEKVDIPDGRISTIVPSCNDFAVSADRSTLVYRAGKRLRAIAAGAKPPEPEGGDDKPGRHTGWLDLDRIRVNVDPAAEWRQMYQEAWRLQRDYFWTADMSGVDWVEVRERYLPLLDLVSARSEFADLMWDMQGELGTSHAYEQGGDYRKSPSYGLGFLGADLALDRSGRWSVRQVIRADHWDAGQGSPLDVPGVRVRDGDTILAVNGRPVGRDRPVQAELVNTAGLDVELTIGDARGRNPRRVVVRTVPDEEGLRYRAWVEDRRRYVHEHTDGRVGYVHVPDMSPRGYAEFHRSYLTEAARDALIVDVRDNGGGFVSQLLLEKLARQRVGYDLLRYGPAEPYPADSPAGPMVCVTNQNAGSDGDIFSHCWKLFGLGPLVGTRTWGGVIGIDVVRKLVDDGLTTQPQASFWFTDVGFGVENYGTDPDVVVDITPQDWAAGADPQLDRALELIARELRRHRAGDPMKAKRPRLPLPNGLPRR
jgi:tricorn protease